MTARKGARRRLGVLAGGAIVAVVLMAVLIGLADLKQLVENLSTVRWGWVALAAGLSLVSYAATAGCHHRLLLLLGHRVAPWTLVRAVTVAMVANRSLRSGGAAGVATLSWLLSRHGVRPTAVVTSHLGLMLLTNSVFAVLFFTGVVTAGLAALSGNTAIQPAQVIAYSGATVIFTAGLVAAWLAVASARWRRTWTGLVTGLATWLGRRVRRPTWADRVRQFLDHAVQTAEELLLQRASARSAWAWSALRIGCSIGALWLCFVASDVAIGPAVLLLGYTAAKAAGVVSLVPAGLGIVEGSMVSVFVAFGIPYESALLAALLNRAVYHVLPALVALVVAGSFLRDARAVATDDAAGESAADEAKEELEVDVGTAGG